MRWAAEKIVRKCSVPGVCSAQSVLSVSVQFLFFAEIARRSLAEREGGNIQILKSLKENTDKGVKGRFVFVFVHFVFSGYFITGLHVY